MDRRKKLKTSILFDVLVIGIFSSLFFIVSAKIDLFETVYNFSRVYEVYNLDEVIPLMSILSVAFLFIAIRHALRLSKALVEGEITEKKLSKALDDNSILFKELHHRIKNNFQLIISLLSVQSDKLTDKITTDVFRDSLNRIKIFSSIHEILYTQEEVLSIDLSLFITQFLENIKESYDHISCNIDFNAEIENTKISINQMVPLGLVINEIVTNSFKHAFKDISECWLWLNIYKIKEKLYIIIGDNGTGFIKEDYEASDKSIGISLINLLVTKQLAGNVFMTGEKGTEYIINFTLEE